MGQPSLDITCVLGLLQVNESPSYMGQLSVMALRASLVSGVIEQNV